MAASSDQVKNSIRLLLAELIDTEESLSAASACLAEVLTGVLNIPSKKIMTPEQRKALTSMAGYLGEIAKGGQLLKDEVFYCLELNDLHQHNFQLVLTRFNTLITKEESPFVNHLVNCGIMSANNRLYLDLFVNKNETNRQSRRLLKSIQAEYTRIATGRGLAFNQASFHSLFSMPMQRVMRYSMLLVELSKQAPENEFAASLKRKAVRFANTVNSLMLMFVDTQVDKSMLLEFQETLEAALSDKLMADAKMSLVPGPLPVLEMLELDDEDLKLETTNIDLAMTNAGLSLPGYGNLPLIEESSPSSSSAASSTNVAERPFTIVTKKEASLMSAALAAFAMVNKDGLLSDQKFDAATDVYHGFMFTQYLQACQNLYPGVSDAACKELFNRLAAEANNAEFPDEFGRSAQRADLFRVCFIVDHPSLAQAVHQKLEPVLDPALQSFLDAAVRLDKAYEIAHPGDEIMQTATGNRSIDGQAVNDYFRCSQALRPDLNTSRAWALFFEIKSRAYEALYQSTSKDPEQHLREAFIKHFKDSPQEAPSKTEFTIQVEYEDTDDVAQRLKTDVLEKIQHYLNWRKDKGGRDNDRGYKLGFFTRLRHMTDFGKDRAEALIVKLGKVQSDLDVRRTLAEHFRQNSTLNNHSLDTYLLEALQGNQFTAEEKRERVRASFM